MSELFLVARIAGQAVAVASRSVESVVDLGEVTPAPLAARHVLGLATLRSRIVTVIDTAGTLTGEASAAPPRRAIVSAIEGHHYAFVVDALDDVAELAAQPLDPGIALSGHWADAASALVEPAGEAALVIDLAALVPGNLHSRCN
ncbi:chemotaxis protein CheW [Sphingomonas spermidinifaciens]|uniref:Chemotaxis protein CheW n=1 Tax=Sphingomonas spermidinifaciens TaxID=1141889 RepID=A0A2A4B7D0_9SPHN|nr:chemotaxis protein CheW [Sphingomonas spermidinifaciens]PCD03689.1 chemotaxis protein CheW [Sphingomonas spermidinifaciens]